MLKLMKLELKHNRIKGYIFAAQLITVAMLGLTYLFAFIPRFDKESSPEELALFTHYHGLTTMICVVSMGCFTVLAAVMFNRFVIEEYTGKKAILLFSYPVDRSRILWAKVLTVLLFTIAAMTASGLVTFAIFFITEAVFHIVQDTLTLNIVLKTFVLIVCDSLIAASFAAISLWFGYWKKSASATIVANIILISLFGYLLVMGMPNALTAIGTAAGCLFIGYLSIRGIRGEIMKLEV